MISDHFHPWTDAQGQSPFVWAVIGGIAQATERLRLGTGVTCPTIRIHPAIIAQAAATAAAMMDGRFFLGLGTGENLNEHVVGEGWPAPDERLAMLEEAIEVIRLLWEGGYQTHRGEYYDGRARAAVHAARASRPTSRSPPRSRLAAELAGRLGDAFINTAPDSEPIEPFESAGGKGKPKYGRSPAAGRRRRTRARRPRARSGPTRRSAATSATSSRSRSTSSRRRRTSRPRTLAEAIPCGPDAEQLARGHPRLRAGRVYAHLLPPDRPRPGGLLPLLVGAPAEALTGERHEPRRSP